MEGQVAQVVVHPGEHAVAVRRLEEGTRRGRGSPATSTNIVSRAVTTAAAFRPVTERLAPALRARPREILADREAPAPRASIGTGRG